MTIKRLLTSVIGFASVVSASIITPSGYVVPSALEIYLDCPIGNIICKNGKGSSCNAHYNVCEYGNPIILDELLEQEGYNIGDIDPVTFCKIHKEVCDMIHSYNPPLTDDYIYNLDRYLTCGSDDTICQYGENASCKTVLEMCWDKYPKKACQNLSDTCDKLFSDDNKTTTKKTTTTTTKKTTTKKTTTKKTTTKKTTTKKTTTKKTTTKKTTTKKTTTKKTTTKKTTTKKTTKKTTTKKTTTKKTISRRTTTRKTTKKYIF